MKSKKIFFIGLAVVVIIAGGVFFWQEDKDSARSTISSPKDFPNSVAQILFLQGDLTKLTPEQTQTIAVSKKEILSRVKSKRPLNQEEKKVISLSISTTQKAVIENRFIVDQSLYHFSEDELRLISEAVSK